MSERKEINLDAKIELDANKVFQAYEEIREAKELEIMALRKKEKAMSYLEAHLKQYEIKPKLEEKPEVEDLKEAK